MKKIIAVFLLCCLASCFSPQKNNDNTHDENISLKNILNKISDVDVIKPTFEKEVENWSAYRNVNLFLEKYKNISPNDALNNALELHELTTTLKDSISIEILQNPSFQARLNVLDNEVLRLVDMTNIPAITAVEVNAQVEKILLVFSSINNKINTVFTQKMFEDAIEVKDVFIGLDSTKLDSASLKSIRKENLNMAVPQDKKREINKE